MIHAFFVNCLFVKEMGSNLQTFSSCVMICIYAQKGKKCKREFTLGGLNVCNDNFTVTYDFINLLLFVK